MRVMRRLRACARLVAGALASGHESGVIVQILIHQYRSLVRASRGVHEYESVAFAGAVDEPGLGAAMCKER
jgi:hypothetical protein